MNINTGEFLLLHIERFAKVSGILRHNFQGIFFFCLK